MEVQVEVVKPIPAVWTDPIVYPAAFGDSFSIQDVVQKMFEMYDLLDQCNADRASVKALGK